MKQDFDVKKGYKLSQYTKYMLQIFKDMYHIMRIWLIYDIKSTMKISEWFSVLIAEYMKCANISLNMLINKIDQIYRKQWYHRGTHVYCYHSYLFQVR